jgi:hypothetical protein
MALVIAKPNERGGGEIVTYWTKARACLPAHGKLFIRIRDGKQLRVPVAADPVAEKRTRRRKPG